MLSKVWKNGPEAPPSTGSRNRKKATVKMLRKSDSSDSSLDPKEGYKISKSKSREESAVLYFLVFSLKRMMGCFRSLKGLMIPPAGLENPTWTRNRNKANMKMRKHATSDSSLDP